LEFVDGLFEAGTTAELFDELERRAHGVETRDLEDARVVELDDALVLIFLQQGFEDGGFRLPAAMSR
jgi:hypothetical protein